jgi:hypothetical protein
LIPEKPIPEHKKYKQLRTELSRINSQVYRFVIIKNSVILAYLCYNIVAIQKQLMGIPPQIKKMSVQTICVTDSTHCINNAILCSGNMLTMRSFNIADTNLK